MNKDLTPMQSRLWDLFYDNKNTDIPIVTMYAVVYLQDRVNQQRIEIREMQQKLGPILQRLNRKLYGQHIVPGQMKRTYRLVAKQPV